MVFASEDVVSYQPVLGVGVVVALGYTILGVAMIRKRESFARHGARFHQRVAQVAPWLYPGRLGAASTSEESWRVMIVPLAVFMIVFGIGFGVTLAAAR